MAHSNKIIYSINLDGEMACVDVFMRPDGTFGFDEYRRDAEDMRGWFSVGHYCGRVFPTAQAALSDARKSIGWLEGAAGLKKILASGGDI